MLRTKWWHFYSTSQPATSHLLMCKNFYSSLTENVFAYLSIPPFPSQTVPNINCLSSSLLNFFNRYPKLNMFKTQCLVFPYTAPRPSLPLLMVTPSSYLLDWRLWSYTWRRPFSNAHVEFVKKSYSCTYKIDRDLTISPHYHCCHPRPIHHLPPASSHLLASVLLPTQCLLKTEARLSLLKL